MGDAQELMGPGQLLHLLRHGVGDKAGDARVDLVKDQGADSVSMGQSRLEGQHDPGDLAAGGHPHQGLLRLPLVGGEAEGHLVHAGLRKVLGVYCRESRGEGGKGHAHILQIRLDGSFQPLGRFLPPLRQGLGIGRKGGDG